MSAVRDAIRAAFGDLTTVPIAVLVDIQNECGSAIKSQLERASFCMWPSRTETVVNGTVAAETGWSENPLYDQTPVRTNG